MNDQALYNQVAEEIARDDLRPGLWARAFSEAEGEKERARALYIKFRVQELGIEAEQRQKDKRSAEAAARERARTHSTARDTSSDDSPSLGAGGAILWWLMLAISSWIFINLAVSDYSVFVVGAEQEYYFRSAAGTLGETVGLLLFAHIFAGIIWLIYRIAKGPMRTFSFMALLTACVALDLFMIWSGARFAEEYYSTTPKSEATSDSQSSSRDSGSLNITDTFETGPHSNRDSHESRASQASYHPDWDRLNKATQIAQTSDTIESGITNELAIHKFLSEAGIRLDESIRTIEFPLWVLMPDAQLGIEPFDTATDLPPSIDWEALPFDQDFTIVYCWYSRLYDGDLLAWAFVVEEESRQVELINGNPELESKFEHLLPSLNSEGTIVRPVYTESK